VDTSRTHTKEEKLLALVSGQPIPDVVQLTVPKYLALLARELEEKS
jgi:hypothetical protein